MNRPRAALKVAAVACSVVLAAGFVSYRAGAFDWVRGPAPALPETPPEAIGTSPEADPAVTVNPESPLFISGSKTAIFVVPPGAASAPPGGTAPAAPATPTTPTQPKSPTFIGGSKSIAPLIPPTSPAPADGKSPPAQSASPPK